MDFDEAGENQEGEENEEQGENIVEALFGGEEGSVVNLLLLCLVSV